MHAATRSVNQAASPHGLSVGATTYVLGTLTLGLGLCLWQLGRLDPRQVGIYALAALASVGQVFKVHGHTPQTSYNVAWFAYGMAFALMGPPQAIFVMLAAHLVEWILRRSAWHVQLFNIGSYTIAILISGWIFDGLAGPATLLEPRGLAALLSALVAFTLLNHLFVGLVIRLVQGQRLAQSGVFSLMALYMDLGPLGLGAGAALLWRLNPIASLLNMMPLYLVYSTLKVPALERKSDIDTKTELFNARYFSQALERELARARRERRPLSVVLADLDYLRDINNAYGHLAGDEVISGVARILMETMPGVDTIARFGGEEYVFLLPDTTAERAFGQVDAVRVAVESASFGLTSSAMPVKVTMSFGIAGGTTLPLSAAELMENADTALYAAKLGGRNQVRIYSPFQYEALFGSQAVNPPASSNRMAG